MISYVINPNIKARKAEELLCEVPEVVTVNKFTEESVEKFKTSFYKAEASKQDVIPIVIDSYGGQVYSLLAMIDVIKSASKKVATIVSGKAMSCGAILFSTGSDGYRFVAPSATVMIHDVSSGAFGKVEDLKVDVEEADRLNKMIYRMLSKNVGKSENYFLDIVHGKGHTDWYLTADDCVEHGLANHIRVPKLKVSVDVKMELV